MSGFFAGKLDGPAGLEGFAIFPDVGGDFLAAAEKETGGYRTSPGWNRIHSVARRGRYENGDSDIGFGPGDKLAFLEPFSIYQDCYHKLLVNFN